jgi:hypothetical protein
VEVSGDTHFPDWGFSLALSFSSGGSGRTAPRSGHYHYLPNISQFSSHRWFYHSTLCNLTCSQRRETNHIEKYCRSNSVTADQLILFWSIAKPSCKGAQSSCQWDYPGWSDGSANLTTGHSRRGALPASCYFLTSLSLRPCTCMFLRNIGWFYWTTGLISQKIYLFIATAVRIWNPTYILVFWLLR